MTWIFYAEKEAQILSILLKVEDPLRLQAVVRGDMDRADSSQKAGSHQKIDLLFGLSQLYLKHVQVDGMVGFGVKPWDRHICFTGLHLLSQGKEACLKMQPLQGTPDMV